MEGDCIDINLTKPIDIGEKNNNFRKVYCKYKLPCGLCEKTDKPCTLEGINSENESISGVVLDSFTISKGKFST